MKSLVVLSALFFSFCTFSADPAKGKSLYSRCVTCHGNNGEGKESQKAPRIGGQHDWYIYSSLVQFKTGERKNPEMMPYIRNLSDTDFQDLAAYISTLKN